MLFLGFPRLPHNRLGGHSLLSYLCFIRVFPVLSSWVSPWIHCWPWLPSLSHGTIASQAMAVLQGPPCDQVVDGHWKVPTPLGIQTPAFVFGFSLALFLLVLALPCFIACFMPASLLYCLPCACLLALSLTLPLLALFMHYTCLNTCLSYYTCLLSGKCFVLHNYYATTHAHAMHTYLLTC